MGHYKIAKHLCQYYSKISMESWYHIYHDSITIKTACRPNKFCWLNFVSSIIFAHRLLPSFHITSLPLCVSFFCRFGAEPSSSFSLPVAFNAPNSRAHIHRCKELAGLIARIQLSRVRSIEITNGVYYWECANFLAVFFSIPSRALHIFCRFEAKMLILIIFDRWSHIDWMKIC